MIIDNLLDYDKEPFKVYNFDNKLRLGNKHNGGFVLGNLDNILNYDCFINTTLCDEFTIDFIKKYNMKSIDSFAFNGKGSQIGIDNTNTSLVTIINKQIGIVNNENTTNLNFLFEKYNNIFLKMDIEGGEWSWLSFINEISLSKITQLVIELHGITNTSWHKMTINSFNCDYIKKCECLRKLANTHYLIHAHGNNNDKTDYKGIPNVIKLTYVNKNYFNNSSLPVLNTHVLPITDLDFPDESLVPDIDLNFVPFVNNNNKNPFLINIPDKTEYTLEDYINIQQQLNDINIDNILTNLYPPKNTFYDYNDFKKRISRGINQTLIDISNNLLPVPKLYKIGDGGNGRNCIVCTTSFTDKIHNKEKNSSRFIASQQILKSLEEVGFNGYFYLFNGGFPTPTGTEMKYVGVPYCFKIFLMLEAQKKGFDKVIWVDSGCYALNNPQQLFDMLYEHDTVIKTIKSHNNYDAMSFKQTIRLLNQLTNTDIHSAYYIESVVLGLNLESQKVQELIKEYYEMVKLGWPFFSIFPEEIVLTALFNKPEYKTLLHNDNRLEKTRIAEKYLNETNARQHGYFFHHKDYSKYTK